METLDELGLEFRRVLFLRSTKEKTKLIGKIRQYRKEEGKKKEFLRDIIVIANENSGIKEEGRYDVKVRSMVAKLGFIVCSATRTYDEMGIGVRGFRVAVLVNNKEDRLRTEDNMYIPLYFDPANWYDPDKIVKSIRRKAAYLYLSKDFVLETYLDSFLRTCAEQDEAYKKHMRSGVREAAPLEIEGLKSKFNYEERR